MGIAEAFPDYPLDSLPAIPAGWLDVSWHNDNCPSYMVAGLQVFIDYATQEMREHKGEARFLIVCTDSDATLLASDDWQAVIDFVDDRIADGIDAEAERSRA